MQSIWPKGIILFFLTLVGVQALILYFAFSTHQAPIVDDPWERGLAYEQTILALERGEQWSKEMAIGKADAQGVRVVDILLRDQDSNPVVGAHVRLQAKRPADATLDTTNKLVENKKQAGRYSGSVKLPQSGLWFISLLVDVGDRHILFRDKEYLTP